MEEVKKGLRKKEKSHNPIIQSINLRNYKRREGKKYRKLIIDTNREEVKNELRKMEKVIIQER